MTRAWWRSDKGRAFLRELGSIVLGVLIALALGAVASEFGWRLEVRSARAMMAVELGEALGQGRERVRTTPCFRYKLKYLGDVLTAAEASGRLPPVRDVGSAPIRSWSRGGWNSILSAETASHFGRDELDNISGVYEIVDLLARSNDREQEVWATLLAMVGPGRPLSSAEAAQLRDALQQARMLNNAMGLWGARALQIADAFAVPYDRNTLREYGAKDLQVTASICHPLGPVPTGYDSAPLDGAVERATANPITRDNIGFGARKGATPPAPSGPPR